MTGFRFFCLSVLAFAVAWLTPLDDARAQPKLTKVTFAVAADAFYYIPLYVAEKGNLFREEGLEIDYVVVPSGTRALAAVAGGSVDAAINDFASTIHAISQGSNHIILCNEYSVVPHNVVLSPAALAKSGITPAMSIDEKLKRMSGLRIGVTAPGSGTDRFIRTMYNVRSMDPNKEVQILSLGDGNAILAAFERGLADGFVYSAPIPQMAVTKGTGVIVVNAIAGEVPEYQDVPYVTMFTSRGVLASKPQVINGLVRAMTKSIKLIREKPDLARTLTRPYFPEVEERAYNDSFEQALPGVPKGPVPTQEQFTKTLAQLNASINGNIKVGYRDVIDPTMAERAAKEILGN